MQHLPDERRLDRATDVVLGLVLVVCLAIVLGHPHPPMNDASSHIATAWIAQALAAGDGFTAAHYAVDPIPVPYWLATAVMTPLVPLLGPLGAFRALLALYVVGLVLGFAWLLRVLSPRNRVLAPAGALGVFCWAYWLGEIPFVLGQPLAVLGAALFATLERVRSGRFALFCVVVVATYLSHLFALAALLGAVGCVAVATKRLRPHHLGAIGVATAAFLVAAWLVLAAHGTDANQGEWVFDPAPWRLAQLMTHPLATAHGGRLLPLALGAAIVTIQLGALAAGRQRALVPAALLPAAGFAFLAWLGPAGVRDSMGFEDIGERFTLMAFLFGLGAVAMPRSVRARAVILGLVTCLCAAKLTDTWASHVAHQPRAERLAALLEQIPERQRLLPLFDVTAEGPDTWLPHRFGNYVVFLRHGYSPHVFARTGQQPLRHVERDEYRLLGDLTVTDEEWASFGYVLVQSDAPDGPRVPGLTERADPLGATDGFSLWAVKPPAPR